MWERAQVFEKRLKYVGNDVDMWETAKICVEIPKVFDNGLNI